MALFSSPSSLNIHTIRLQWLLLCIFFGVAFAQLSEDFYSKSCPKAFSIIESGVKSAIAKEARMGASLFRLHFHDCLIGGCDGSILLDDTQDLIGEKNALPNHNSARGFDVIDEIKAELEKECPGVVSCADILTVVARDSVVTLGGPNWTMPLGRRDSTKASRFSADAAVAIILAGLNAQILAFELKGFSKEEFVALTGGHTVGMARCQFYRKRIYGNKNIDPEFAKKLQENCPKDGGDDNVAPIDTTTPTVFDNAYFTNLVNKKGLLESDQQLYTGNGGTTDEIVLSYSSSNDKFFEVFSKAIVKMGKLDVVTGDSGEIRTNCRKVNGATGRNEL